MEQNYYILHQLPDLSLSRYTTLDEGNVDGVLKSHATFWRQMHRRGILTQDAFHLFYEYDPQRPAGHRLQIGLRVDTQRPGSELFVDQTIQSSPLRPFYDLQPFHPGEDGPQVDRLYAYQAHLVKKEAFRDSMSMTDATRYYITSEWEMNEQGRLYTMTKLMEAIRLPCLYCVSIYPRDMAEPMRKALGNILFQLRKANRPGIDQAGSSISMRQKDENAKETLKFYEDLLDDLAQNPNFLVDVQVLSDNAEHAAYILDAAAAEAVSEGSHEVCCFRGDTSLSMICESEFLSCASQQAPPNLRELPHLFLLEQLVPFAVFPALYAGEWIEMPKESAPPALQAGLLLGRDNEGHDVYFPLKNLSKHAFLAGVPGSGKTNSMMHLIAAMHVNYQIPVLILEPAKHEYRAMTCVPGMEDLELFSPSASTRFPLHINPFEFPRGMTLAEHIRNLLAVFDGAFSLEPPMPFLLDSSVEEVYRDHNWMPAMINVGRLTYPTMSELYKKLEDKLNKTDYAPEIQGNLKSALQVRIGSLLTREMGDIFDVPYSTVPPEQWLKRSAIIELEAMGKDPANFTTLMVATLIRETLKVENYVKMPDERPRHVIFFEEAHNLIGPTAEPKGENQADPKTAATAYIVKMLAEVRALGEGIVIADQLPTAMAPEVIKNTSLKIALRITAQDDRQLLGGTINANPDQLENMSIFRPGHALVSYEPLLKPFEVQLPFFKAKEGEQDDGVILDSMITHDLYWNNLFRSLEISIRKWNIRLAGLKVRQKEIGEKLVKLQTMLDQAAKELETADKERNVEIRTKMYRRRDELYQLLVPFRQDVNNLVVAVMAYMAPFNFLFTSKRVKDLEQVVRFKKQMMDQTKRMVIYQRQVTQYFQQKGLPEMEQLQKKHVQQKEILLHQESRLPGFAVTDMASDPALTTGGNQQ